MNLSPEMQAQVTERIEAVRRQVLWLTRTLPSWVDRDDFIAAGMVALVQAAHSWRPDSGRVFATWVNMKVYYAVKQAMRDADHLSRTTRRRLRESGEESVVLHPPLSLSGLMAAPGVPLLDTLVAPDNEEEEQAEAELLARLQEAVRLLPDRERYVLTEHYWFRRKQHEIAADLGLTPSRISQICESARRQVRELLAQQTEAA